MISKMLLQVATNAVVELMARCNYEVVLHSAIVRRLLVPIDSLKGDRLTRELLHLQCPLQKLSKLFNDFDMDSGGSLDAEEFFKALNVAGPLITGGSKGNEDELVTLDRSRSDVLFSFYDTSGDGAVLLLFLPFNALIFFEQVQLTVPNFLGLQ